MWLSHPELINRTCEICKDNLYNDTKKQVSGEIAVKNGKPQRRPKGAPTPCKICPKKGPEYAKVYELSLKNLKTLGIYYQVKATSGACLQHPIDPILQKNLGIIEANFSMLKDDQSTAMMLAMLPLLVGGK